MPEPTLAVQYIREHCDLSPMPLVSVCGLPFTGDVDAQIDASWNRYIQAYGEHVDRMMMDMNPLKEFREAGNG